MASATRLPSFWRRLQPRATLFPYGLVSRTGEPQHKSYYLLHEGPLGVLGNTLKEISYDDLKKDNRIEQASTGGWLGITDKYWLVALVPDQNQRNLRAGGLLNDAAIRFQAAPAGGVDHAREIADTPLRLQRLPVVGPGGGSAQRHQDADPQTLIHSRTSVYYAAQSGFPSGALISLIRW